MTTLSLTKEIPMQLLLCKATTCPMPPITNFFVPQMEINHINNKCLPDYIYYFIIQSLFTIDSNILKFSREGLFRTTI